MGRDTDFNFGWNEVANNADPWGRNTGPDERGTASQTRSVAEKSSRPVSTFYRLDERTFFGQCFDDLAVDAFEKCVMLHLNSMKEELRQMAQLPAYNQGSGGSKGGSRQNSTGRQSGSRTQIPYLKIENLSQDFKTAKILAVQIVPERTDGQRKFSDLHVKILYGGQLYIWGLKFNHPCYGALLAFFGANTDDWNDQEFMLGLDVAEFDGRANIRVKQMERANGKKK